MNLGRVQALAVAELAVFAELLAMVGGQDDHRLVEHGPSLQLVEQFSQLPVQRGDAVVVGVARPRDRLGRKRFLVDLVPIASIPNSARVVGAASRGHGEPAGGRYGSCASK